MLNLHPWEVHNLISHKHRANRRIRRLGSHLKEARKVGETLQQRLDQVRERCFRAAKDVQSLREISRVQARELATLKQQLKLTTQVLKESRRDYLDSQYSLKQAHKQVNRLTRLLPHPDSHNMPQPSLKSSLNKMSNLLDSPDLSLSLPEEYSLLPQLPELPYLPRPPLHLSKSALAQFLQFLVKVLPLLLLVTPLLYYIFL